MKNTMKLAAACTLLGASPIASAQIGWITYTEDNSRLNVAAEFGSADVEEKDYAWGDFDNDGWIDLVIVRKEPFTTAGRRTNVLLMNEGGTLVDRTAQYATASDNSSDAGFATPTNDRDVIVVDVNLDGWMDIVTSTTISPNLAKRISHPRVYLNLGDDSGGNWLGFRYEVARIPNFGTFPNFCGVAAGDVTGDGYPDLYFSHYEQAAQVDLDDRLLINDGNGFFLDESTTRMTNAMRASSFGTSAVIADMNGDGVADVVKDTALGSTGGTGPHISVIYNDPSSEGNFNLLQDPYFGAPYHVNVGDLNKDGKLDLVIADDASDRFMLNQGNDALGRVNWSSPKTFNTDDGFGSNNLVADLDNDGWGDVLIADVDVDIPGCNRRLHIYHNRGGTVGGNVSIVEESGSGFRGVKGMTSSDMVGTHDVAVFDLDNDGDLDMVIGRCSTTTVWINELNQPDCGTTYCGSDQNPNNSSLIAINTCESSASSISVSLNGGPPNQFIYLLVGDGSSTVSQPPGAKGDLCVVGGSCLGRYDKDVGQIDNLGLFSTDIQNAASNPCQGAVNITAGSTWNFQYWHRQPMGAPATFSQAISVTFN